MKRKRTLSLFDAIGQFKKTQRKLNTLTRSGREGLDVRRRTALLRKRLERLRTRLAPFRFAFGRPQAAMTFAAMLAASTSAALAQPKIINLDPATNASQVVQNSNLTIEFSEAMNAGSIDADNILIFGSQSPYRSNDGAFSGNPVRVFNPDDDFFPNEIISVTVTNAQSSGLTPIARPLVYQFRTKVGYGSGVFSSTSLGTSNTYDVEIGDLDGDGNLDFIMARQGGQSQRIYLNNGNGTFSSSSLGAGNSEVVELVDLDNDGDLDAVIGNDNGQANELWLNNGDGTFSTRGFGAGNTRGLTAADLDGDGDMDVINANYSGGNVLWLNNGDATFVTSAIGTANTFQGVEHGDIDNDGDMDLFFAVNNDPHEVWLNNGDATFSISTLGTGSSTEVTLGDLDGDGNLDAIVVNNFDQAADILLGNGDGTFASSTLGSMTGQDVKMGDIDGDGDLDVIFAVNGSTQTFFLNNGDGTFVSSANVQSQMRGVSLGDMDGDGDLDIVYVTNNGNSRILFNANPPSAFAEVPGQNAGGVARNSNIQIGFTEVMNTGSLTVDPYPTATIRAYGAETGQISTNAGVSFSNGNRRITLNPTADFRAGEMISVSVTTSMLSSAGLNATQAYVYQFRATSGVATVKFATSNTTFGASTYSADMGDLNGDGNLDILTANFIGPQHIQFGNGDGTFSVVTAGPAVQTGGAALGDLDGDGDIDAIISHVNSGRGIWLNNGDGTFVMSTFDSAGNVSTAAIGDMDGDGDLDVVFAGSGTSNERLWLNNGDATFVASTFGNSQNSQDIFVGDLDNDGDLDVVVGNYGAENIHLNNGDATFSSSNFGASNTLGMDGGDFNGDGNVDLVFARNGAASYIWLGNGDGTFASSNLGASGSRGAEVGDLDGDGDEDIVLFRNGADEVWLNNGDATFVSSANGFGASLGGALGDIDNDGDLDVYAGNYLNNVDQIFLNLPNIPTVTQLTPNSTTATLDPLSVTLTGTWLDATTASLTHLNSSGLPLGSKTISLLATSATTSIAQFPAGAASTAGTLTLSVTTPGGTTSASFTVLNDTPVIAGNDVSFPEDGSTTLNLTLSDVSPGIPGLVVIPPVADGTTIASITQVGGTAATTQFNIVGATNANGSVPLTFTVDDGTTTATTTLTVTILAVPDAPTLDPISKISILQNGVTSGNLVIGDVDTPFGALTVTATSANQNLIADGDIVLGSTSANTPISLAAACETSGTTQIFVTVSDGSGSTTQVVNVCIDALSEAPISGSTTACVGSVSDYSALPATTSASLDWEIVGGAILSGQGTSEIEVQWQNTPGQTLTLIRTYPNGCTTASILNLNLSAIDAQADYVAPAMATSVTIAVLNNDSGAGLSITALENPDNGTASHAGGVVTYTPDNGFSGTDVFSYTITNDDGCTATGAILVAVPEDAARVNLEFIEEYVNRDGAIRGLNGAIAARVSLDGKFVYVAGYFDHSIAIFSRNTTTGVLTYDSRVRNGYNGVSGLKYVHDVQISPDGRWLFAVGYGDNCLVVFSRNETTGELTFLDKRKHGQTDSGGQITALKRPRTLAISPDASSVYVASYYNHAIGVFSFDNVTGNLQWVERQKDGSGGVDGLRQILDVAVSVDGLHVYGAGYGEDEIAMFSRNVSDGSLTFIGRVRDGVGGVDGIAGVASLTSSTDGGQIYAAGIDDDAVAVFNRNSSTGDLTFVERHRDGIDGVEGLNGARDVEASAGGRQVWAVGQLDQKVVLFNRNMDGTLDFVEELTPNIGNVQSLGLSANSQYGYAASPGVDAANAIYRNRQPEAADDAGLSVNINSPEVVSVLDNDEDADGHVMTVDSKTDGTLGTVAITGGGTTVTYSAGAATGADQFTYTIIDGHGGSSTATVSIAVVNTKQSQGQTNTSGAQADELALRVGPNPLRDRLNIEFNLPEKAAVEVALIDLRGYEVAKLNVGARSAGGQVISWNLSELELPTAAYTLVLRADGAQPREASTAVRIVK